MSSEHVLTDALWAIVLIVEDEPLQRMDMVDMAERAGFEVLEAVDADHAVALLEKRTDIRLVITDIDMPGAMDGIKLAAAVRKRWPPIEIIIVTAGTMPTQQAGAGDRHVQATELRTCNRGNEPSGTAAG